jgi:hypothetical protein
MGISLTFIQGTHTCFSLQNLHFIATFLSSFFLDPLHTFVPHFTYIPKPSPIPILVREIQSSHGNDVIDNQFDGSIQQGLP